MPDMSTFTSSTSNPRDADEYFGKDEWLTRAVVIRIYVDNRGNKWAMRWSGRNWEALPMPDAAKAYELPELKKFASGDDAKGVIADVEGRIEAARVAGQTPGQFFGAAPSAGFPWLLVLAALWMWKGRKR